MANPTRPIPHHYAELIKAWADGAQIQVRPTHLRDVSPQEWRNVISPSWLPGYEYRVRPEPARPIERRMFVQAFPSLEDAYNPHNLRLEFDSCPPYRLLKAEVIEQVIETMGIS